MIEWWLGFFLALFLSLCAEIYLCLSLFSAYLKPVLPKLIRHPLRYISAEDIARIRAAAEIATSEEAKWFNKLVSLFYSEIVDAKAWNQYVEKRLWQDLVELKRGWMSPVIKYVNLVDFFPGTSLPFISNVKLLEEGEEAFTLVFDVHYNGCLAGTATIDYLFGFQLKASGTLKSVDGRMFLRFCHNSYSYSFLEAPRYDVDVAVLINGYYFTLANNYFKYFYLPKKVKEKWTVPRIRSKYLVSSNETKVKQPPMPWHADWTGEDIFSPDAKCSFKIGGKSVDDDQKQLTPVKGKLPETAARVEDDTMKKTKSLELAIPRRRMEKSISNISLISITSESAAADGGLSRSESPL